jgi:hypothetical protein
MVPINFITKTQFLSVILLKMLNASDLTLLSRMMTTSFTVIKYTLQLQGFLLPMVDLQQPCNNFARKFAKIVTSLILNRPQAQP